MLARTLRRAGTLAVTVAGLACSATSDRRQSDSAGATPSDVAAAPATAAVRATIEAATQKTASAMKAGDFGALAANYADSAKLMMTGSPTLNGRDLIEEAMTGWLLTTMVNDARFTTTDVVVDGSLAVESGTFSMTTTPKDPKGAGSTTDVGKYLTVWQRQTGGAWKIIRDINNSDALPSTPTK